MPLPKGMVLAFVFVYLSVLSVFLTPFSTWVSNQWVVATCTQVGSDSIVELPLHT